MNHADATREVLWNIHHVWVMYALLLPTLGVAGYGFYRRVKSWRRGQSEPRFDRPLARIGLLLANAVLQLRNWRKAYPGTMHAMIFWGFIVLAIATTVVMIDYDFGIPIMRGNFYLYFQSFFVDVCGAGHRRGGHGRGAALVCAAEAAGLQCRVVADSNRDLRDSGKRVFD